ncbi:MAG TPA: RnfABCDGE type electron transport complex subunit D, partial [Bacilli bacterium]|nr:RnfABCDGE type electron transport complex subunit D [Bacilli bacterium]
EFGAYLLTFIKSNYSIVTAVIFTLTVPIGTPFYVLIVGNVFATLIVKHAFGGFGHNIFNPAALARLLVALAFGSQLSPFLVDNSVGGLVAGATLTSQYSGTGFKWLADLGQIDLFRVFIGNYNGALGETFTFLIIAVGVVLAIREVINWRTPVFYLATMVLIAIPMALIAKVNVFESMALSIGLGGAAFGAIFMLTDPVSSPTGNFGKALIGMITALFTVLIRVAGAYPEGMAFSIAIVNILAPMIDKLSVGQTTVNLWKKYVTAGAIFALSAGTMSLIAFNKTKADTEENPSSSEPPVIVPFVTLNGSYTSVAPTDEYTAPFTTSVEVGLDIEYNIVTLDVSDGSTPGFGGYTAKAQQFVDYYTSISVADFLALPVITEATAGATKPVEDEVPQAVAGLWYSSVAIYQAVANAFSGISVYQGAHTSAMCEASDYCQYDEEELTVDVYVKADKIVTLGLGADGQSTASYATNWAGKVEAIITVYQDVLVSAINAMSDPAELYGETSAAAGVTYSGDRLFFAVQNALEGYGA